MPVDFSLLKMPDIAGSVMDGFERGRKLRQQEQSRNALNALLGGGQQNGQTAGNVDWSALTPDDARTATAVLQARREDAKAQREGDFNRAAYDYSTGQNALLSIGRPGPQTPAPSDANVNALVPAQMQVPGTFAPTLPDQPRPTEPTNPALSILGQPQNTNDRAFLKMLQIDPERAMKFKSGLRDNFVKMVGQEHDLYGEAVDQLATAVDEPSYQRVIQTFAPRMAALGGDLSQMVPPNYPGPDGIRDLTMRALDAKDRLSAFVQKFRADTYANDVATDNTRQDRNTQSLIDDRQRRTNIYADRSARAGQGGGGGRGSGGGGRSAAPVKVNTPAEAMKLPKGTRYTTPDGKVMVR